MIRTHYLHEVGGVGGEYEGGIKIEKKRKKKIIFKIKIY